MQSYKQLTKSKRESLHFVYKCKQSARILLYHYANNVRVLYLYYQLRVQR